MSLTVCVAFLAASTTVGGVQPHSHGLVHHHHARSGQSGRLWVSPTYTRDGVRNYSPAALADYGAPYEAAHDRIFVDVAHVPIAISPWANFNVDGFDRYKEAQNRWLDDHGYTGSVRTHVNLVVRQSAESDEMYASVAMPTPRATIRIHDDAPRRRSRLRVMGPVSTLPATRISTPDFSEARVSISRLAQSEE